jgi:uncharacterized protein with GYD domain
MMNLKEACAKYRECRADLEREAEDYGATRSGIYDNRVGARRDLDEAVREVAVAVYAQGWAESRGLKPFDTKAELDKYLEVKA